MGARIPVVIVLAAMMVAVVGVAIYSVGGGTMFASGGGFHSMNYVAPQIAPLGVGSAPRIAIDDPSDRVIVTASNDRFVHVVDRTQVEGMLWGTPHISPLHVDRTADGVSIARAENGSFVSFGYQSSTERIEVQVPGDATLSIARCGGAEITGIVGDVSVNSVDGSVHLTDLRGSIKVHSDDGRIVMDRVVASNIDASTDDGRIIATFPKDTNATISARTNDGSIRRDGTRLNTGDGDVASQTFTLGSGAGKVALATDDGTISIFTNGAD